MKECFALETATDADKMRRQAQKSALKKLRHSDFPLYECPIWAAMSGVILSISRNWTVDLIHRQFPERVPSASRSLLQFALKAAFQTKNAAPKSQGRRYILGCDLAETAVVTH